VKTPVIFTSANLAYLDRAIVLLDSVRRHQPDWPVVLILVDEEPSDRVARELLGRFDEVVLAKDLPIADFDQWIFGHDVVEACTAVKGAALQLLLDRGAPHVVYLDPDTVCFGPLDGILSTLGSGSIGLTPHQVDPEDFEWSTMDNEITSLKTGVFNFGFLVVKNDETGRSFASWWSSRLYRFCVDAIEEGLFTDQRWGDLVPCMFDGTVIIRDRGVNVASWNLLQRPIEIGGDGDVTAGGAPLRLFHFTKAEGIGAVMTMKHSQGSLAAASLWRWYLEELRAYTKVLGRRRWSYSEYEDGSPIEGWQRRLYRNRPDLQASYPDPFATSDGASLLSWTRVHAEGIAT
jgi:hypothetical protein